MNSSPHRRVRGCLLGLCLLLAGATQPLVATAETPSPDPTPVAEGAASPSVAQPSSSTSYKLNQSPFSITVSPARLAIKPEDLATTQQLTVINRGQASVALTVQKRNFTSAPDGSLNYQADAPYAAAAWLTVEPTQFELAPGATQVVTANFDVPKKPDVGDHQVAVVFLVPAGKTPGNVKVNRGVGAPVFLTVPGPTDDTVVLDSLTGPKVSVRGDVDLTATLRNTGTVHRDFRANTPLTLTSAGATSRFSDFTIPRDSSRVVTTTWQPPLLCVCHPQVTFSNATGAVQSATVRVIIFPWWLAAALLLVGLTILVIGLVRRRRGSATPREVSTVAVPVSGGG